MTLSIGKLSTRAPPEKWHVARGTWQGTARSGLAHSAPCSFAFDHLASPQPRLATCHVPLPEEVAERREVDADHDDHAEGDGEGVVGDETGLDVAEALAEGADAVGETVDGAVDDLDVNHAPAEHRERFRG